jgi:predicted ATP-grasp superfamily ATP-dependent carboligase
VEAITIREEMIARRSPTSALPAVVLGGGHSALSVARSLGRLGIPVDYVSEGARLPVDRSRYVRRSLDFGTGPDLRERWREWLLGREPSVILFCSGQGATLVATHRAELEERGHLPMEAADGPLLAMVSKVRTYELARAAGVPTPWSFGVETLEDLESSLARASYPCVVKPALSLFPLPGLPPGNKGLLVEDAARLRETLTAPLQQGHSVVLTEFIPGPPDSFSSYYSYLDADGEPLFHLTKRKLRQYPLGFGEGTYHLMNWDAEVAELGLRFFQGAGLRGLNNVEFRRDERDGQFKLIECNPRFTAANELLRRAGLDVARLCYERLTGRPSHLDGPFRDGLSLWTAPEDVKAFLELRRTGEVSTRVWLRQVARRHEPFVFAWSDPLPAVTQIRWRGAGLARNMARRLGGRASLRSRRH